VSETVRERESEREGESQIKSRYVKLNNCDARSDVSALSNEKFVKLIITNLFLV
jgi:hypothetical protein